MKKPNCTITDKEDKMLDDLALNTYATRSEALRVAIRKLDEEYDGEQDRSVQETLMLEMRQLRREVKDLGGALDEIKNQVAGSIQNERTHNSEPVKLDNVYQVLDDEELLTLSQIAEQIDGDVLTVREVVETLVEKSYATCVNRDGTDHYRIKSTNE